MLVGVRPQDLQLAERGGPAGLSVTGEVSVVEPLGAETFVHIEAGDETIVATTTSRTTPRVGTPITATAPAETLSFFDAATERSLRAQ